MESGSFKIMVSGRNRGKLGKNVKYFTIEKGLKGGSQEKRKAGNAKYRRWEACTPFSLLPLSNWLCSSRYDEEKSRKC